MAIDHRLTVQIVSHGPGCLDGVVAAAAIARFYAGHRVVTSFAANGDSDRIIQKLKLKAGAGSDEIWITDLSWNSVETGTHLTELARAGARIFWVDHHRTAVSRATAPEFKVPFAGTLLSEQYSAARLAWNFLEPRIGELSDDTAKSFNSFYPIVALADDHDRWVHVLPDSPDWALAVQTLGSADSYREILALNEPILGRKLKRALLAGREAMDKSRKLARSTVVDTPLPNGLKLRTACCFGYSSEVAADLYEGQHQTVIALFDLRSQGVSLRRSADCEVDLSALARSLGGGGHAAASGFMLEELRRTPAERLSEILSARLAGA
jgi:oligoribonuclease NrnB/cAMP/cGMP phosphodiesterase (DHH superfamily)